MRLKIVCAYIWWADQNGKKIWGSVFGMNWRPYTKRQICTKQTKKNQYIDAIELAWGLYWGNIGQVLFLQRKLAKKEQDQYSPIWTEQAILIKFLL